MALTAMTAAQLLAAGFVKRTGQNTLYDHPRYPGFLFKIVETLDQAMACGGIYLRGTSRQLMYFGLDMEFAHRSDQLGQWGIHTSVMRTPVRDVRTPLYRHLGGSATASTAYSSFYIASGSAWTTLVSDYAFVGVISKADRGFLLDHETPLIADVNLGRMAAVKDTANVVHWSGDSVNLDDTNGKVVDFSSGSYFDQLEPQCSGYISNNILVDRLKWITFAKPGFIAGMDADQEVKDAYSDAFDEIIADPATSGQIADAITVYPTIVEGVMKFHTTRLTRPATGAAAKTDPVILGMYSPVPRADPVQDPDDYSLVTNTMVAQSDRSWGGMPFISCLYTLMGDGGPGIRLHSAVKGHSGAPAWDFSVPAGATLFTFDQVPFVDVQMYQQPKIKASAAFGVFGPNVMPAATPTGTLDMSNRVERELEGLVGNDTGATAVGNVESDTQAQKEAKANKVLAKLDARKSDYARIVPYLTPFTRMVTETVVKLDSIAKGILCG